MKKLFSISISGLATMNLHSLNNEGGEGNHIQTRMVDIVDKHGKLHPVNAVSGDMFKHIFVEHFQALAMKQGLKLCAGCRTLNANRLNADSGFEAAIKDKSNAEIANLIPQWCALDDVAGILITQGNRSVGRKSVLELGWVTGVPERVTTDSFFHVKYDPQGRGKTGSDDGSNTGQAIFHRPASSGQYAVVAHLEAYRIGLNDITQTYAIDEAEREQRFKAVMKALAFTFLEPNGAMRNTQNPHLTDFTGVITTSTSSVPAPTVSPLNPEFREQVEGITNNLNRLAENALELHHFGSLSEFAEKMTDLTLDSTSGSFGS
ncbi:DevR family CRISPR-associated autoregulator [Meiothermus sp.]|jgi:CRISPR-associated protein Cst2|uniref:DevR family CRISPR-associated autoregulator n=1 Tax=Meiothermus sp. TaxID=1955249 RepID=UPI0021DDA0AE|nr:DevR family CRISPR-associated autoregulator [Meiothermus sp.]GIW26186.1 MAG: CRISPR-associated protein DevR [Meiothermus sp.]